MYASALVRLAEMSAHLVGFLHSDSEMGRMGVSLPAKHKKNPKTNNCDISSEFHRSQFSNDFHRGLKSERLA